MEEIGGFKPPATPICNAVFVSAHHSRRSMGVNQVRHTWSTNSETNMEKVMDDNDWVVLAVSLV